MEVRHRADADRDVSVLATSMASVKLKERSVADDSVNSESDSTNTSAVSRSFLLDELNENSDSSTLEVYKDILNEKIHLKSKIPTASLRTRRTMLHELPHTDSKLPISRTHNYRSPYKRNSMVSVRSVSDSPSQKSKAPVQFQRPTKLKMGTDPDAKQRHSTITSASESKRRVHSMILASGRALNTATNSYAPMPLIPSTPESKRIPSYLKQTTSSMKKVSAAAQQGKENKENQQQRLHSYTSRSAALEIPPKRKLEGASHRVLPTQEDSFSRQISRRSLVGSTNTKTTAAAPISNLEIPKLRSKNTAHAQKPRLGYNVTGSIKRSMTQDNLSASIAPPPTRVRKISSSMEKRKPSAQETAHRGVSIRMAKKIPDGAELYRITHKSPLIKTWEKITSYKFTKISPISPKELTKHSRFRLLNNYERSEVIRRAQIYYVGDKRKEEVQASNFENNFGFDDGENNYITTTGDHINYRYRVLSILGNGAFGSVVASNDYKEDQICAVKIVKNEMTCSLQAVNEVKILKALSLSDPASHNVVSYFNHFHFRGHMCIVTEFLPINLYQVLELSDFRGFSIDAVATFASQILNALRFLHSELGIIHCDLKPENLMLTNAQGLELKLIDFGSAVAIDEISYSYLQSRFYRAPEVALGARYNEKIDIWSFACILVELYNGVPLFPCENEDDLLARHLEVLGQPDREYIQRLRDILVTKGAVGEDLNDHSLLWKVFDGQGRFSQRALDSRLGPKKVRNEPRTLESVLKVSREPADPESRKLIRFLEMISSCLVWDYDARPPAAALIQHDFIAPHGVSRTR